MTARIWLTPAEFRAATGWGAPRTYRALREGRLRGRRVGDMGGRWRVLASEVQRLGGGES